MVVGPDGLEPPTYPCKGAALPTELRTRLKQFSVHSIFQCFAWTELRNFSSFDFNRSAGAGIATCASCALAHCERTKTDQRNSATLLQGSS